MQIPRLIKSLERTLSQYGQLPPRKKMNQTYQEYKSYSKR